MKIDTLLKAGGLAVDIFTQQSTRQLSGLVRNGIRRRADLYRNQAALQPKVPTSVPRTASSTAGRPPAPTPYRAMPVVEQWPNRDHLKKAMQYVTPENFQKAAQWHGILKSLLSKD